MLQGAVDAAAAMHTAEAMHAADMKTALLKGAVDAAAAELWFKAQLGKANAAIAVLRARFDKVCAKLRSLRLWSAWLCQHPNISFAHMAAGFQLCVQEELHTCS